MKKFLKPTLIFFRALPSVLVFELVFKLVLTAVGAPVLALLLKLTMKISQVKYISDERAWIYLKNPATITVILIVLFFAALFTFAEISALAACYSSYACGERMGVGGMIRTAWYSVKKAMRRGERGTFLKFMAFMPLVQFTTSSGVFVMPLLPILKTAFRPLGSTPAMIVFIAVQALLIFAFIGSCYSIHFHLLTDLSFPDCQKRSQSLMRGKRLENALRLIMWSLLMLAAAAALTFIISFFILLFIKGFSRPRKAFFSTLKVLRYAGEIFSAISAFISAPAVISWLTGRFFSEIPKDEKITLPTAGQTKMKPSVKAAIITTLTVASCALNFTYIRAVYKGNINLNVGILTRTQITAHRGFSKAAPENTLYAFEAALDSGADYIELDVQLTADNELVVFHDKKLDRATDSSGVLGTWTYDQLCEVNAAGKFAGHEEYGDARIPLLSEVFELMGNEILYNIEIKDYGNNDLAVEKTVELIHEYDLESSCYVTSFSYNVLKKVKKLDPQIKTGLIANAATTAAFAQLRYIDALSMNHLLVNSTVVNNAHQNGKRIFVWTVDSTAEMQEMMALGVDNIITNRPDKAAELIYSKSVGRKIITIIKAIFN